MIKIKNEITIFFASVAFLCAGVFALVPAVANAAADLYVADFGSAFINGTYVDNGTVNGDTRWYNASAAEYLCYNAGYGWGFWDTGSCAPGGTRLDYYADMTSGYATPADVLSWIPNSGSSPGGTVSFTPPAPPTPSVASSTLPCEVVSSTTACTLQFNPNQDYFEGLALFLFGMTLILWLFKGRK